MGHSLAERILARLEDAEHREPNPHFQSDYRIAWITVLYASRGHQQPFVTACYQVLGCHPDKLQSLRERSRRTKLGSLYESWPGLTAADVAAISPKKPPQSVKDADWRARRKDKASGE